MINYCWRIGYCSTVCKIHLLLSLNERIAFITNSMHYINNDFISIGFHSYYNVEAWELIDVIVIQTETVFCTIILCY